MIVTSRKKFTAALALTLAIFFGSIFILNPAAQAAALKDLNQCADYAKPAVDRLAQSGVISGDQNGYFNPQQSISRAQMVTLIVKSLGLDKTITPDKNNSFQDVPRTHWANQYVEIAYQAGITSGVAPGQFGANQSCTREQMITLFVNSFKLQDNDFSSIPSGLIDLSTFADADKISDWAYNPVAFSVYMGLINGTSATTMDPKIAAQRQQVAVLIDRFIDKKDSIVNDMQAQRILGKTVKEQFNGEGISNTGKVEIKVNLQEASLGFPAEFSLKAQVINEALWPATLHQYVKMELTGLPHNDFPAWEMEQYLVDGVLYQKNTIADNDASWSTMSLKTPLILTNLWKQLKNARIKTTFFFRIEIHNSIDVKLRY